MSHDQTMTRLLLDVARERGQQRSKWGVQRHGDDRWVTILTEEVGEVARAVFEGNRHELVNELVQVAAVALAHAEAVLTGEA